MKIVFLTTVHNSLSQRAFVELVDRGHTVIVVIASSEAMMLAAVEREHPDLIVAPMLKTAIPASIWQTHTCIIVLQASKETEGHLPWTGPSSMPTRNGGSPSCKQTLKWMPAPSGLRVPLP